MRIIKFMSDRFRPYLPDQCQVNPNVLGFELAEWLSRRLANSGVMTSYPNYEDWGWFLEHLDQDAEYLICCSGYLTPEGAYEWRVFVKRPRRLFRRPPATPLEEELLDSVVDSLHEEGIETVSEEG